MKNALYLWIVVFIVSLSGLLSGYDTGVISGILLSIDDTFKLNSKDMGLLVSSVSIGAIFGALINGVLVDKIGRKKVLLLSAVIFLLGSILCSISENIVQLILFRTFLGIAVGIVSFAGPLYLSEISTKEKRGGIVSFYQIALTFGILFSYLSNYLCVNFELSWRIMFLIGAIPAFVFFVGMFFQNDTPRWYVLKNKIECAEDTLKKFNFLDIDSQIDKIKNYAIVKNEIVLNKKTLMPFIIGIGIMFAQIATGINAIIYYSPTIFKSVGFNSDSYALFVTIFIGLINFLMTFVAVVFVDKVGRKPLLYFGLFGMTTSLLALSLVYGIDFDFEKYVALFACAFYIICFSMSLGPVALLLISEIFPLRYRGSAMSISIISNFIFNFIVTGIFPIMLNKIGGCFTFMIFAAICLTSLLFVYFVVPETKGIALEEIESGWQK